MHLNIYSLLEKSDRAIFSKISSSSHNHPLRSFLPVAKESSFRLRTKQRQWTKTYLLPKQESHQTGWADSKVEIGRSSHLSQTTEQREQGLITSFPIACYHNWVDSTTVMCWLVNRGEWFTFIGNRVKKIRTVRFILYLASVYCLKHSRVLENTFKKAQLIENRAFDQLYREKGLKREYLVLQWNCEFFSVTGNTWRGQQFPTEAQLSAWHIQVAC